MKKQILSVVLLLLACTAAHTQDSMPMPQPDNSLLKMTLGDALQQRRSGRSYDNSRSLTPQQLSTLLWAACGVSDPATGKITAPSAVNMQDIVVYVCTRNGVARYDAKQNLLVNVSKADLMDALAGGQAFVKDAPVNFLLVSDQTSQRRKNDRWGKIDCGYVSQNIYLACTAMGLQTVARAMMDVDKVRSELKLADDVEILLNHPIGYGK